MYGTLEMHAATRRLIDAYLDKHGDVDYEIWAEVERNGGSPHTDFLIDRLAADMFAYYGGNALEALGIGADELYDETAIYYGQ
jgi:hypothetical protein